MSSLNQVQLIGNLGNDPEIRHLQDGTPVANFSLATTEKWTDKNTGEKKEQTEWHRIVVWGDGLINVIQQYLRKGSKVFIQGQNKTRKWQDQNGNDKYITEVVLQRFGSTLVMLGGTSSDAPAQSAPGTTVHTAPPATGNPPPAAQPAAQPAQPAQPATDFGDVPF